MNYCCVCRCRCSHSQWSHTQGLPLREQALMCIVLGCINILDAICCCCCCPINSFKRCARSALCSPCRDLWNDWYYRPPTARQFYTSKKWQKKFNTIEERNRLIKCLNTDKEIEMNNLEQQEPQTSRHWNVSSNQQQTLQNNVSWR